MLKYVKRESVEFLLLLDMPGIEYGALKDFVSRHMRFSVRTFKELSKMAASKLPSERIYAIGTGGEEVMRYFPSRSFDTIPLQRLWKNEFNDYYSDLPCLNITSPCCFVDDVVGSGKTLWFVKENISEQHAAAFCLIYNNNPSQYKDKNGILGYKETIASVIVDGIRGEPYWFPAIYSVRHLLEKPKKNPNYISNMAKRYFAGDTEGLARVVSLISQSGEYLNE